LKTATIFFEYEEIKEGRKVNEILFRIKTNHWLEEEQQTLEGTKIDEYLKIYIGKKIYFNGYNWKIISVSNDNNNKYSIYCHEIDDTKYTRTFEITENQLKSAK